MARRRASCACDSVSSAWNSVSWVFSTVTMSAVPARSCCSASSKARREAVDDIALQLQLDRGLLDREQRIVDVGEGLDDGLAVGLEQLVLPRLGVFEIAEDLAAVEDRLRRAADELEERRVRLEQRDQRRALIAAIAGELDGREELRAGVADIGGGGGELRLLPANVGPLRQQLRRQAGRHARGR